MNHYRSSNLLNIQRVKITVPQQQIVKQKPTHIIPPRHARAYPPVPQQQISPKAPPPPVKPAPKNRPVTVTSQTQRSNRPNPVFVNPNQQKIVSRNRSVSLVENRRGMAKAEAVEQYRQAIMRIKDMGVGKILVILANGPSINEIEVEKLNNNGKIDLMCINKPNQKVWPTKFWAFCDQSQYSRNQGAWDAYSGTLITATAVRARHRNQILIKNISGTGFSKDMVKGYYIGRSSTYAAMQVALWMNYDKVYIFGCDMAAVNGQLHFYGQNPDVNNDNRVARFKQEGESFLFAAQNLSADERQHFVFCSNYNKFQFLDYFPRLDHLQAVQAILEDARSR